MALCCALAASLLVVVALLLDESGLIGLPAAIVVALVKLRQTLNW